VRDVPGDPEMQPKLSDETKDLILKVTSAAGPENAALVKMLVESAYVDGAAEMLNRVRGTVAEPQDEDV
jgi:hypothetical protein